MTASHPRSPPPSRLLAAETACVVAARAAGAAGTHDTELTSGISADMELTALNIAVYGSLAVKKKYAWWNSTDAFTRKRLYLNLLADADAEEIGLR